MQYSNIGYAVAGQAAENVAKVPYKDLVREKIFGPLGMANSGFSPIEMGTRPNHGRPHYADSLKDAQAGRFHEGEFDDFFEVVAAAGEVYSNVYDILKWGSTIMNYGKLDGKQVLNRDAVEEQLTAYTIARSKRSIPEMAPATNYGLGWAITAYRGQAIYEHGKAI
jgi:CubicO group peptidase (beta-lactamase class C family)